MKRCEWIKRTLVSLAVVVSAIGIAMGPGVCTAFANDAAATAPDYSKTLTSNGDGTYTMSLSVTGKSSASSGKADVIVVLDTSSSMNDNVQEYVALPSSSTDYQNSSYGLVDGAYVALTYSTYYRRYSYQDSSGKSQTYTGTRYYEDDVRKYVALPSSSTDYQNSSYGLVDGTYVALTYSTYYRRYSYQDSSGKSQTYTGTRYYVAGYETRMDVARDAVNNLAKQLLASNTASGVNAEVRLSLVTFANTANPATTWTDSLSTFQGYVSAAQIKGGTNWEDALKTANAVQTRDDADTYIVFVSDGDPTYRLTQVSGDTQRGPENGKYYYGTGSSDTGGYCYSYALAQATNIVNSGKTLYSIGVFGDVTKMKNLATQSGAGADNYHSAVDAAGINAALANIIGKVTASSLYKNATITDGLTMQTSVNADLATGGAAGFTYTRSDGAAYDGPKATFDGSTVTWDMGDSLLANGVTYTLSFRVWPSQEAYDTVAGLQNGTISWADVDLDQYARTDNGDGTYSYLLKTNTSNKLSYTQVLTKTTSVKPGGTLNSDGSITGTDGYTYIFGSSTKVWTGTMDVSGTTEAENPTGMDLKTTSATIKKAWIGGSATEGASVTLALYIDGVPSDKTVTLNEGNNWTTSVAIVPGIVDKTGTTLEKGHDYTLSETTGSTDYYEFSSDTEHPMLVNGVLNYGGGDGVLTGTNTRKSTLTITKSVTDNSSDESADANQLFTYNVEVTDPNGSNVRFSVVDAAGVAVTDGSRVSGATTESGSYTATSGSTVTVKIKAGEKIYFDKLANGSTYSITETNVPAGYTVSAITNNGGDATSTAPTATGTIAQNNLAYAVGYTNAFDSVTLSGDSALGVTKEVTGHDAIEAFSFGLTPDASTQQAIVDGEVSVADGALVATTSDGIAAGTTEAVNFGAITFYAEGTYTFAATETTTKTDEGWTYDTSSHDITVTVTKNDDSQLVASVQGNNPTFTNAYVASPTTLDTKTAFGLTKQLTGRDWNNDSFTFMLTGSDGAPMPTSNTATVSEQGGTVDFGSIAYDKAGVYTYTVVEDAGSEGGVAYDTAPRTVTVTVTDDGAGKLAAAVTSISGSTTFTNVYDVSPAYATVTISKMLTGHDMTAGQFTFNVSAADNASAAKAGQTSTSWTIGSGAASDGSTAVSQFLSNLEFTHADVDKTYSYAVSEASGGVGGYTYDTASHIVKIAVTDNGDGTLAVNTTVDGVAADTVSFGNSYSASGELGGNGSVSINGTKTLTGQSMSAGEFSFKVADASGATVATGTNTVDGTINFTGIEYTTASVKSAVADGLAVKNTDGTYAYTYTVTEKTDGLADRGITATTSAQTIKVTLTDDGAGNLVPKVTYPDGGSKVTFENAYATNEATINVAGTKVLSADEGLSAPDITGKYTFTLAGDKLCTTTTATNDASGNVNFGSIAFTADDLEGVEPAEDGSRTKTFDYTVTESGSVSGVTNDSSNKFFSITVTDNGKGVLTATSSDPAFFKFTNIYSVAPNDPSVTDDVTITKDLAGRDQVAGEFTFSMKDADNKTVATGTNAADGAVTMTDLTFAKPGTYTYTLSEEAGTAGGMTYDATTHTVTAQVTDNGNGTMSVAWTIDGSRESITFTNAYAASPTEVTLGAVKRLEGKTLTEGEFTFQLMDADGNVVSEAKNAADGSITFDAITYDAAGTYTYKIVEVGGSETGVTYDTSSHDITVVVTDNLKGSLVADVTGASDAVFTNTYVPNPSGFNINATKVLKGRTLADGEFTFQLLDASGNVLSEAKNAADGTITFSIDGITKAGTYTYQVKEVAGSEDGITYDTTVHTYRVTVEDVDGQLTVTNSTCDGGDQAATFTNTYTKKAIVKVPDTGDVAGIGALAVLAAGAIAIVAGTLAKRKNEK